jgi:cytochrome c oxidase assembly protein subunit 11
MKPEGSSPAGLPRRKGLVAVTAAAVSVAMLALSFAAVPLYRLFCATTGFAGTPQIAKAAASARGQRTLTVRFDSNVAPGLAWKFIPEVPEIKLRTGDTATVYYKVTNLSDHETAARAMFNVTPDSAGAYFDKIACFCFSEQKLGPGETSEMPVVFFLDPALEKDATMAGVEAITLSYTFFAVNAAGRGALAAREKPL